MFWISGCFFASSITPTKEALITPVGPPDWPTTAFALSASAIFATFSCNKESSTSYSRHVIPSPPKAEGIYFSRFLVPKGLEMTTHYGIYVGDYTSAAETDKDNQEIM